MDLSVELVGTVLLGMLALGAPPVLSTVLFRVLVRDGVPLNRQEFHRNRRHHSLTWFGFFILSLLPVFFGGNASMPDRSREASSLFEIGLIIVFFCFLAIFVLKEEFWLKRPHFIKAFPFQFFFLVDTSWTVLFLHRSGMLTKFLNAVAIIQLPDFSTDINFELLASTVLLGMLALSAPPVLSIVLFRVMVKEGFPLDSQKFRHDFLIFSLTWLGLFILSLFLIFFVGNASMADRLQEASFIFGISPILALIVFSTMLLFRKKLYLEDPDFISTLFAFLALACFGLLVLSFVLVMKRAQVFMDEGPSTASLHRCFDLCQDPSFHSG